MVKISVKHHLSAAGLLLAIASMQVTGVAQTATPTPDAAVVARAGASALILLDATGDVATATRNHVPHDQTMTNLETMALKVARDKSSELAHSTTLTVRVLYDKTGDVSPAYGMATYEGSEKVFDLSVPRASLASSYDKLSASLSQGKVVAPLQLQVTGDLPPV